MEEVMYDHNSVLICTILMIAMVIALEIGFRGGRYWQQHSDDGKKAQLNAVQGGVLGLLALLLGFTFSLSLQRYDDRSKAVVDEANAIGTTMLRAQLLAPEVRGDVQRTLREYLDLRVRSGAVSMDHHEQRAALLAESDRVHARLWEQVEMAIAVDDRPVTTGLYLQSLNDMIDSYGRRDASLDRHVPEAVLFLLFLTFVMVSTIVGVTSGVSGSRPPASMLIMVLLIVLLVFIIIDLDRPRRGLIEVNQASLLALQESVSRPVSER